MVGELHSLTLQKACARLGELRAEIATLEAVLVSLTAVETHPAVDAALSVLQKLRDVTVERDAMKRRAEAAEADWKAVTTERDALRDALMEAVQQACYHKDGEVDSMALSAYADALRLLATAGLFTITHEVGRRVIGRWTEPR
jgi:hypothetical protein